MLSHKQSATCATCCALLQAEFRACAGSKGSVRIKEAAVVALPSAMRGGLNSLFRASQTFNPQNLKRGSLGRLSSLGSLGR